MLNLMILNYTDIKQCIHNHFMRVSERGVLIRWLVLFTITVIICDLIFFRLKTHLK